MSQVFGADGRPAYLITRKDQLGTPLSLSGVLPESKAILFQGAPGMGKTTELNRVEDLAELHGWTTIRVTASENIPLEHHLTTAFRKKLEDLQDRFGKRRVRGLSKTVRDLTESGRNTRWGWEARLGGGPVPVEFVGKREKDTTAHDKLGTTLNDFADELGRIAGHENEPILLLIDKIDAASEHDQAGVNDLAIHLEEMDRPVWLVVAGGTKSTSSLMHASRRMSGIATTITNQFSVRELEPLSDADLAVFLTEPLDAAEIPYEHDGIDVLVRAANGNPSQLRKFALAAVAMREPERGITAAAAEAATVRVWTDSEHSYQSKWNQPETTHAQKDLLARVAAQGTNGLYMPPETRPDLPDEWQQVDRARQELVARGMLREHDGQLVTIPDKGFRDWVNTHLDQTPALARGPEAGRPAANLAPVHLAGERAAVNRVFGAPGQLVEQIDRKDKFGRPISLDQALPIGTTVLFTGPPGIGTSHELTRTKALADREGWISIRFSASRRESVESRIIRAVQKELDTFKQRYPADQVKELKEILNRMAVRTKNSMNTAQLRAGLAPGPKIGVHRAWEGVTKDSVGRTLSELGEQLGKMAGPRREPIVLMVDNLDAASDTDLVALTGLSATLHENRKPAFLIAAGGNQMESRLLSASGGRSGTETELKLDVRELVPMNADEMRTALVRPLSKAGIRCEPGAVDKLVEGAQGHPSRLRTLAGAALELVQPGQNTITTEIAVTAASRLNTRSQSLYAAAWANCSDHEMALLAKTAAHGTHGVPIPSRTESPDRWDLDNASKTLISRGLLTRTDFRIHVTDPGFQDWVQTRLGTSTALSGIAAPVRPQAQRTTNGGRTVDHRPALGAKQDVQQNR
ncbi:AAA ATPase-like protein [Kribbella sp. VKM Ac-2571]|uniref:AAA family ATPase n=1 Tax=Kribbella sp. VKM Ac-2571 TaxID=2512222 RepID=UPI00105F21CA|nr:AAA family ATPase [Kribbella sp. VKM Ac-2571]TDO67258.1 AAA ATPase-like protein [Kribbella sp. VKM Ac-2571]